MQSIAQSKDFHVEGENRQEQICKSSCSWIFYEEEKKLYSRNLEKEKGITSRNT